MAAYGDHPDTAYLAAAYAFGMARNHPFLDGNRRTAFGWLEADDAECISTMESVASGDLAEKKLATWLGSHIAKG